MRCPVCNFKSTKVVDSRMGPDGLTVRRRRECEKGRCNYRFSTMEEVELLDLTVIKRNGRRESYRREKLLSGLRRSLEKRPCTDSQIDLLLHNIEHEMHRIKGSEITTSQIGDLVIKHLKDFDPVAYIRFASVYFSFDDIAKFEQEVVKLKSKK
ncbi:MAG: transcriptional regulator NrdR [Patescibacteria group bacterium]